jgi:gentisate 1,2-dioxygenase
VRFVLEGNGAETTVDGKVCPLNRGDLILTPGLTWHAHSNQSDKRVVWVDMLDLPLIGKLGASFYDPGPAQNLPHSAVTLADESYARGGLLPVTDHSPVNHSPRVRWSIAEVLDVLQRTPENLDGSRIVRYTDPVSGGAITPTLDVYAVELHSTRSTQNYRNVGSTVCVVIDGEGETRVGDQIHNWKEKDIFTLPNWTWRSHRAYSRTAHLLHVTDREFFRRAGLYREQFE